MDPGGANSLGWRYRNQPPAGQVQEKVTESGIASGENSSTGQPRAGRATFENVPASIAESEVISTARGTVAVGTIDAPTAGPGSDVTAASGDFLHERGEAATASPSAIAAVPQPKASPMMAINSSVAPLSPPSPTITAERVHSHRIWYNSPATCRAAGALGNNTGARVEKVVSSHWPSKTGAGLRCSKEGDVGSSGNRTGSPSKEALSGARTGDIAIQTITPLAREPLRELVARGGGGDGGVRENAFVDEARVATVQCYLRDEDPIFIRINLNRLIEGTLAELIVGDFVNVARRCREGERNEGGAGSITRVLPDFFYDVKYVVGGTEKGVDGCFLEKTELGERKRRGATPRCPDCRSFLHECTCDGYLDIAAMAAAGVPSSTTEYSKPPAPPPLHSKDARSLKRPRSSMDSGLEDAKGHPSSRGDTCDSVSGDRVTVGRGEQAMEEGSDVYGGKAQKDVQRDMGVGENNEIGRYCGGGGDVLAPALIGQHTGVVTPGGLGARDDGRHLGTKKALADDLQRREMTRMDNVAGGKKNTHKNEDSGDGGCDEGGGERGCPQKPTPNDVESERHLGENGGFTHEVVHLERESNDDSEGELWTQRKNADVDPPKEGNHKGDINAASRVGPELKGAHGSGGSQPNNGGGGRSSSTQWRPRKGDLVEVERRTSPGVNKLGGTARVVKVGSSTGAVDVRYVVEGGWERGIDPVYVRPAVLDMAQKRPTLGRCSHCGSLRVDCAGRCEFFKQRSSRRLVPPPPKTPLLDSEIGTESVAGERRPKGNHGHDSRASYLDEIELTRRNENPLRRRRRYLPEDWDEEGDPVSQRRKAETDRNSAGRGDWWMEDDSDGTLGGDDLATGSLQRRPGQRLGKPGDEMGSSTDGEIKLLSVVRDRQGSLRKGSVGSGSESSGIDPPDSASDASGVSDSEEGSGGENFSSSSERGGVGSHGWRGSPGDASDGSAVARFLMPEGEEAARMLPSDIADPTRGVKDPARLRRELKSMLQEMEERDANELEQEIPAAFRRLASSSRRPSTTINRDHRELMTELRALTARTTRTLRRLDVANNIFIRLEKLEKRWREGNEGVNAWHRLDGLSNRLEQLRRDANKALREHDYASRDSADSDSDGDGAGGSSISGNSSDYFDLLPRAPSNSVLESRRRRRQRPANGGQNTSAPSEGGVSTGGKKRSSVSGVSSSSDNQGGEKNSISAGRGEFVSTDRGSSTIVSSGRERGREKKRRRRGSSNGHGERRRPSSAPYPRGSRSGGYRWMGRDRGDVDEHEATYLLGLDYSMVAESDESRADGNDPWDSEDSSLSPRSPSISPPRSPSRDTVASSRGDQRWRRGMSGSKGCLLSADGGGLNRVEGMVKDRGSGSATSRGVRRGGGASVRRVNTLQGFTAAAVGRGRRSVRSVITKRRSRPRTEINGRALMEEQYRYRLAQQQARGVPQSCEGVAPVTETADGRVLPRDEPGPASARSVDALDGREKDKEGQVGGNPTNLPRLPSLVEDLMSMPRASRCSLRFKTLYSQTLDVTAVTVDGLTLEVNGVDPCAMIHRVQNYLSKPQPPKMAAIVDGENRRDIPDQSSSSDEVVVGGGGIEGGGELIRVLGMLPQRMADLEELAKVEGLDGEVRALAKECCELMAVIGAKLRAPCFPRGVLRVVRVIVERLVEACAPGRDAGDGGDRTPGLSLTRAMEITERFGESPGSAALVETCVAFHMHLLEWLAVSEGGVDDMAAVGGPEQGPPAGTSGAGGNRLAAPYSSVCKTLGSTVVDFARQLLLDLLFLFEKRFSAGFSGTAPFLPRRDNATLGEVMSPPSTPLRHISRDPLSELLSAVIDTLDGTAGDPNSVPGPAASVSVPGLARPLVGFWAVFFEIVSGGTASSPGSDDSWNVGLQSELVWKALIHAFRVNALCRGWNDYAPDDVQGAAADPVVGVGASGTPPEALTARRKRRKETSGALWDCVRLLLAASPFCEEFRGRDQALAVTMIANATAAARQAGGARAVASEAGPHSSVTCGATSTSLGPSQPIVPALEVFSAPGMMARVLLERVLVLARFRAPEAGPRRVIEILWGGVSRISRTMCLERSPRTEMMEASAVAGDEGHGESTAEERKERRLRTMRKSLFGRGNDLSLLLSATVDAWALPVHRYCRLPAPALQGVAGGDDPRGKAPVEGDYEALCSLLSLITQEHAARVPEGLKRRKLANELLKAKHSPAASGLSTEPRLGEDDEDHALAASRVLVGVALGLAREGLVANVAKEVVKAAAVRPRNITADTPRDRSIFLTAPAAAALCLTLPPPGCGESASVSEGGRRGGNEGGVRATLFGVLADCMRDAVDLMVMVLDGAGRLGQAVNPERLERPRAAIGLAASCILLALRHLGPSSPVPSPPGFPSGEGDGQNDGPDAGAIDGTGDWVERAALLWRASVAVGAFAEVLGRALQARVVEHLGSPALNAVMACLLQCLPSTLLCGGDETRHPGSGADTTAPARENVIGEIVCQGFAMGWWSNDGERERDFSHGEGLYRTDDPPASGATVASEPGAETTIVGLSTTYYDGSGGSGADGVEARQAQAWDGGDETRDEYGSWDGLVDDAELDALLTGGTSSQPWTQSQGLDKETEKRRREAAKEAEVAAAKEAAAKAAAEKKREEKESAWRSLAEGARLHVLPHLHEIVKKAFTVARFAEGSSAARLAHGTSTAPCSRYEKGAEGSSAVGAGVLPIESSRSSAAASGAVDSSTRLEVDASIALEVHASAALVSIRGGTDAGNSGSSGNRRREEKNDSSGFSVVRAKYLDVHRMAHNPVVPQQRLLAPAFFCVALGNAHGRGGSVIERRERETHRERSIPTFGGTFFSHPAPIVTEAVRGREWELLHLWMQAAFDPLAFPVSRRRGARSRSRRSGRGALGASEPSEIVRERFPEFTRALRVAFGSSAAAGGGAGVRGGRRGDVWEGEEDRETPPLDEDIAGVFDKRLTHFEAVKVEALSLDEARVLSRILDAQSVVAHCGSLWAAAVTIAGPEALPEATRKRIKDRVVKLTHGCIKCLRRFISEVFPKGQEAGGRRSRGSGGNRTSETGRHLARYGSTFRRLYGHAAYALAAFLMRMCGGALKGLPLRELVEACFEGLACRPAAAAASGSGSNRGASAVSGSAPNAELTGFAGMHLPDLLQCFSEMPMTVAPVANWIKNINDHAINGNATEEQALISIYSPFVADDSSSPPPLIVSLASGLRGHLRYPSRPINPRPERRGSVTGSAVDIGDFAAAVALMSPPRSNPTALLAKRVARMRLEVLGDRKLRMARFLMEAATARKNECSLVEKTKRLLELLTEIFRRCDCSRSGQTDAGDAGLTGVTTVTVTPMVIDPAPLPARLPPAPPLCVLRDILPLMRPVYSLLGEALLGEPSPARQLRCHAVAAAAALSVAGLDETSPIVATVSPPSDDVRHGLASGVRLGEGNESPAAKGIAECFADAVVLAVSTKLDTFLGAMRARSGGEGRGCAGSDRGNVGKIDVESGLTSLADLGPRESQLETMLRDLGSWDAHGDTRGWPHYTFPAEGFMASRMNRAAGAMGGDGGEETPLLSLLEQAGAMATALTSCGVQWDGSDGVVSQRVKSTLVPRVGACRRLLAKGDSGEMV